MKNAEYWRERFSILEESAHNRGMQYLRESEKIFIDAQRQVQADIERWYGRFAKNNGISLVEARKMLSVGQLEEFRWTVDRYIKIGKKNNLSSEWVKKLENASAKFHVSRLESIQLQIQQQIELLYGNQLDGIDALLREIVSNGYTRTAYEIQKGIGLGWDITALDQRRLDLLLSKPWTTDGRTFSDRIWLKKQELVGSVHRELTQGLLRGDSPQRIAEAIKKQFGVSQYQAERLVHTETSYFNAVAIRESYRELDISQVEVIETLDSRTCAVCGDMDGQVVLLSQYEPGVTVPPYHPNCRGTTAPYYDDMPGERAARKEKGKVYYVPANMTYKDWEKAFVSSRGKTGLVQVFQTMARYLDSKGVFDIEAAKADYRESLQTIPEDNRIYLEQSLDAVEYVEEKLPESPFGYLARTDTIYFDPSKGEFFDLDFTIINTHELAHRIDSQFIRSWENKEFQKAVQKAKEGFEKKAEEYIQFCEEQDEDGFLSDILSAICEAEYELDFGHSPEYWRMTGNKEKEIFANLFSLESLADTKKLAFLREFFPELMNCYQQIKP